MKTIEQFIEAMNNQLGAAKVWLGGKRGAEHLVEANKVLAEQVVALEMRVAALTAMAEEIRKNADLVLEQVKSNANAVLLSHAERRGPPS